MWEGISFFLSQLGATNTSESILKVVIFFSYASHLVGESPVAETKAIFYPQVPPNQYRLTNPTPTLSRFLAKEEVRRQILNLSLRV